jgi:N-methylhydantoinase A
MAAELGIERVLCPRACGVLSALGLAAAAPRRDAASTVMLAGDAFTSEHVQRELERLIQRAATELGEPPERVDVRYELRYEGQSFELTVDEELNLRALDTARLVEAFEDVHERRYGYRDKRTEVELVNVRVSAVGARPTLSLEGPAGEPPGHGSTRVVFDGEWVETELWRGELPASSSVCGPALCALPESTLFVPPGWSGAVDEYGTIVLEHDA